MAIVGFFLALIPLILTIRSVPIVKVLLLSSVADLSAIILAVAVGITVSLLAISIAWFAVRPFQAMSILAISLVGAYLIFLQNYSSESSV